MKTSIILGAGFSKNSNIPVMSEISGYLIEDNDDIFDREVSMVIKQFLADIFGTSDGKALPGLDDILTCLDISTYSGHHLGIKYSPMHLRALRRLIIYKLFKALERPFVINEEVMRLIKKLSFDENKAGYIVLNWDCVLENYLLNINGAISIDYCNSGIYPCKCDSKSSEGKGINILKIHGSSNWLYCDNCRTLFNDIYGCIPIIKKAGFKKNDFLLFDKISMFSECVEFHGDSLCSHCKNNISSHIATLSYRKSFRSNSFPNIWREAEKNLSESERWIFIGYSLPEADYEFKHLLKIAQLKYKHLTDKNIKIDVVLFNSTDTLQKYKCFFGDSLGKIYNGGIEEYLHSNVN